jgi:hypothetical protein
VLVVFFSRKGFDGLEECLSCYFYHPSIAPALAPKSPGLYRVVRSVCCSVSNLYLLCLAEIVVVTNDEQRGKVFVARC